MAFITVYCICITQLLLNNYCFDLKVLEYFSNIILELFQSCNCLNRILILLYCTKCPYENTEFLVKEKSRKFLQNTLIIEGKSFAFI